MTFDLQEVQQAARVFREFKVDRASYAALPIGSLVARYLDWLEVEGGALPATLRDYEYPLAAFAKWFADLDISAFDERDSYRLVQDFWYEGWRDRPARTRAKIHTILKGFFRWCIHDDLIERNPMDRIRRPKIRQIERSIFTPETVKAIWDANPRSRDRACLALLFGYGIRKAELQHARLRNYDEYNLLFRVYGKGSKVRSLPVTDAWVKAALDEHWLERKARDEYSPDEFLLHPERFYTGSDGRQKIWEDRFRPLEQTACHHWWGRCLGRAGLDGRGENSMHHARHTAITELLRTTGKLKMAQLMAGHVSIATTADIYGHADVTDLAEAFRERAEKRDA